MMVSILLFEMISFLLNKFMFLCSRLIWFFIHNIGSSDTVLICASKVGSYQPAPSELTQTNILTTFSTFLKTRRGSCFIRKI